MRCRGGFSLFLFIIIVSGLMLSHASAQVPLLLDKTIVDLTHSLRPGIPYFPGTIPFATHPLVNEKDGYRLNVFSASEHHGTHIDAPLHFFAKKNGVDKIPLDLLLRQAVKIDVSKKVSQNPDYQLQVKDIKAWEKEHGPIPKDSYVLLETGWSKHWSNPQAYLNKDKDDVLHFPGFSCEAAQFLIEGRHAQGLGIDTLSVDAGSQTDFCAHKVALKWDKLLVENLAHLDKVPAKNSYILVAPLKLKEGSGAPARVWVWLP